MVEIEQRFNYRLHPTVNGYTDVTIRLDDQDGTYKYIRVFGPNGKKLYDEVPEINEVEHSGSMIPEVKVPLKEIGAKASHLHISICAVEEGYDHWALVTFQAMEPTDGFNYYLECEKGLQVCLANTFIHGTKFNVFNNNESIRKIHFSCHEWFNEGTGLVVVISEHSPLRETVHEPSENSGSQSVRIGDVPLTQPQVGLRHEPRQS